jgi:hypothetical protein
MASSDTYDGPPAWPFRSRSCMTGIHADCGHVGSIGYGVWDGGRVSVTPCRCTCHSACLLAGRAPFVSRAIWVGLCTCPGTELAEATLDEAQRDAPDFSEFERQWRERWGRRQ